MASLKFELKQFKEAINYATKGLMLNENELKALLILGLSHKELGNQKKAKDMLSKYLVLDPGNQFAKEALVALEEN